MKLSFLTLTLLFLPAMVWAQGVSSDEALQIAERFFAQQSSSANAKTRRVAKVESMSVSYTASKKSGDAALYVINRGDNDGFVVVSGIANTDILCWVGATGARSNMTRHLSNSKVCWKHIAKPTRNAQQQKVSRLKVL